MDFLKQLLDFGEEVSNHAPMSERIMMGVQTMLLGMGVIFAVLIILLAVLSVFKLVFYKGGKKEIDESPVQIAPDAVTAEPEPNSSTDEGELVAVITAAIASMLDAPTSSFRVVSFRRTAKK